jgi:hypothetical protein
METTDSMSSEKITVPDPWLDFVMVEQLPKTKIYLVVSKCSGDALGKVRWYPPWRHYCFFPTLSFETVHSDRCLLSISKFVTNLNNEHKKKREESGKK